MDMEEKKIKNEAAITRVAHNLVYEKKSENTRISRVINQFKVPLVSRSFLIHS